MDKLNSKSSYKIPGPDVYKTPIDKNGLNEAIKQALHGIEDDYTKMADRINYILTALDSGASGTFTTVDGKTVTVAGGIITGIV